MSSLKTAAAFFDVDGTLISIKSLISFARYLEQADDNASKTLSLPLFNTQLLQKLQRNVARFELNRHYFSLYRGRDANKIDHQARQWFYLAEQVPGFYIDSSIQELQRLKRLGMRIVLVSGSFQPLLQVLIEQLAIDDLICTTPEVVNGIYTGELLGAPCIGETKRQKILKYALENDIDLDNSWAFGDDDSDLPMLNTVGNGIRITNAA